MNRLTRALISTAVVLITLLLFAWWSYEAIGWTEGWGELQRAIHGSVAGRGAMCVAGVLIGVFAFGASRAHRFRYGVAEVAFAVLVMWKASGFEDSRSAGVAFMGAIYVIVRGFGNMARGREEFLPDFVANARQLVSGKVVDQPAPTQPDEKSDG